MQIRTWQLTCLLAASLAAAAVGKTAAVEDPTEATKEQPWTQKKLAEIVAEGPAAVERLTANERKILTSSFAESIGKINSVKAELAAQMKARLDDAIAKGRMPREKAEETFKILLAQIQKDRDELAAPYEYALKLLNDPSIEFPISTKI